MSDQSNKDVLQTATRFVNLYLDELCVELKTWDETGILDQHGKFAHLRESLIPLAGLMQAQSIARQLITSAAIAYIVLTLNSRR